MAKGGLPVGRLSRRIFTAAFLSLLITAGTSAAFLTGSVSSAAPSGQAVAVAALSLLTGFLFALAWFLRVRVLAPLEALRRSLAAIAAGALTQPVAGIEQRDEIGATARAAERIRQAVLGDTDDHVFQGFKQLIDRLSRDAMRLEADLAKLSSVTHHARADIEQASAQAAKAGHAAIAALQAAAARRPGDALIESGHFASDADAEAVLASLEGDLEALERFARDRKTIAAEAAATLTVALVEAIDRLNSVADRISAAADLGDKSAAA